MHARLLMLITIGALASSCATGRYSRDAEIKRESGFLGALAYSQNSERLAEHTLAAGLEDNPATTEAMAGYAPLRTSAVVLGAVGGGLIGWPIGQSIGGSRDPNWTLAYIGAGVLVGNIILESLARSKLDQAVEVHNQSLSKPSSPKSPKSSLTPTFLLSGAERAPALGLMLRY